VSYYVITPPQRTGVARVVIPAAVVSIVLIALAAGWAAARPVRLTVDGRTQYLPSGMTVEGLRGAGVFASPAGRLLAVDGSVVASQGGEPPSVARNGRPAAPSQRLFPGDVVTSEPGADRRESLVVTDVPIPFGTRYSGSGPLTETKRVGSFGLRRVTRGAVSSIEVTSTVLRKPTHAVVVRTRPKGRVVALTFDDGPWRGSTERILSILKEENVKATFFMAGKQASKVPSLARQVAREGHSIGAHGYSHRRFTELSEGKVRVEVRAARRALLRVTGRDSRLIRPPYGAMDAQAWAVLRDMDMRPVLWDVDSRDWTKPGPRKIELNVLRNVRPGSVVLMHDGGGDRRQTIRILPRIIHALKRDGYTFVTLDQLGEGAESGGG
jgi:peptidoglycan/xylan/chitin deacetylase (PgdA/CDA1 family)